MKMKVREPVKEPTKVRGRETVRITMVVSTHGEFAMKGDGDAWRCYGGDREDDGSRMEKFVDNGSAL